MKNLLFPCLALSLLCLPSAARAQTAQPAIDDEQARIHYQAAASYYEQAAYADALREFETAYRMSQRSALFYNISLCHQQLGQLAEAIEFLERYLHDVEAIENRAALEIRLENLRARRAEELASAHPTPVEPPPSTPDAVNVPAIAGFSIAALGLISGGVFSGLTLAEDSRIQALPCADTRTCSSSELDDLGTFALVADISWGVSLAGAIVGTVFLFVDTGSHAESHASLRIAPLLGTTNGLLFTGSF